MTLRQAVLCAFLAPWACATGAGVGDQPEDDDQGGVGGGSTAANGSSSSSAGGGDCPAGYEKMGMDCVDTDECALGTDDCDPAAECTNLEPGFSCGPCPAGFTDVGGDGTQCDDIDECVEGTDDCDPLAGCVNDEPGFHCGPCPSNTTDTNGDGTLCTPVNGSNVVGLDDRHGYDASSSLGTGSTHAQFRAAITGAGKTISVLNNLDAASLVGLGALFVQQPYSQNTSLFSSTEISAIVAFVNAGGGLVIIGDGGSGGNQANLNLLAGTWGVTFSTTQLWPNGLVVTPLAHAITAGVTSFGVDYGVPMTVNAPAVALNNGADVTLAAVTGSGGSGNVVFVSDSCFNNSATTDYNINTLHNAVLLDNIISFVEP